MPRKPLTLTRAAHDGKVYLALNLKLWQSVIGILLGLIALWAAGQSALSKTVTRIVTERVKVEFRMEYQPALDQWKKAIDGQIGGLRRTDSENKAAIAKLQDNELELYRDIGRQAPNR